ncbi:hypothetical protein TYRP_005619 [Tyrophagus putrescentiae]|nr:hypothetical protein TYRP_005619 [Tyrophagus putrescentiae]
MRKASRSSSCIASVSSSTRKRAVVLLESLAEGPQNGGNHNRTHNLDPVKIGKKEKVNTYSKAKKNGEAKKDGGKCNECNE